MTTPITAEKGTLRTGVDPNTGLEDLAPTVEAAVNGADVGVSLWEPPTRSCLLGVRIGSEVTLWRLTFAQLDRGELPCDPHTALQLADLRQPQ